MSGSTARLASVVRETVLMSAEALLGSGPDGLMSSTGTVEPAGAIKEAVFSIQKPYPRMIKDVSLQSFTIMHVSARFDSLGKY